jgi:hypothetical protein
MFLKQVVINSTKSKSGDATSYDAILKIAQSLEKTDEWIQQNQEKIRKLAGGLKKFPIRISILETCSQQLA